MKKAQSRIVKVYVKWSSKGEWHMYGPKIKGKDNFIQEFYPCKKFGKTFLGLSRTKKKKNWYRIKVTKLKG